MRSPQVLIVGAGPTGLTLAAELARSGVSYRLVERVAEPAQWSQALVVQARTLEQFERYGLAEKAVANGRKIHKATFYSDQKPVLEIGFDEIHSRYPFVLLLPQSDTERLLIDYLAQLGGQVERNIELVTFHEVEGGVEATLRHEEGQTELVTASYLVGCDGAHSVVRHHLGIPFEGNAVDFVFFLGDVHISGSDVPQDELRIYMHRGNVVFIGRLSESVYRVIVALHMQQQEAPDHVANPEPALTLEDFQHAIDAYASSKLKLSDPTWMTRFRINQRKTTHYRMGPVFLAGDASHIHSPVAGQGMNTGIQDAANLAWKLTAVLQGASGALLDSYEEERGRVGEALLATTSRGLEAATSANPVVESLRDHVLGTVGKLSFIQEQARGFVSETAINYRHSSIVRDNGGDSALRAGDRAPDATYHDATGAERSLAQAFATPHHLLVLFYVRDNEKQELARVWPEAQMLALQPSPEESVARLYCPKGEPIIYAIRPDGYIGFRDGLSHIGRLKEYANQIGVRA